MKTIVDKDKIYDHCVIAKAAAMEELFSLKQAIQKLPTADKVIHLLLYKNVFFSRYLPIWEKNKKMNIFLLFSKRIDKKLHMLILGYKKFFSGIKPQNQ